MFTIRWTEEAADNYSRLRDAAEDARGNRVKKKISKASKQEGLFKQLMKCIELLGANPRHPGLHTHEYDSLPHPYDPKQKVFEAYAQNKTPGAYRVFWCYGPDQKEITLIAITAHP
jgi:hypothetical protein